MESILVMSGPVVAERGLTGAIMCRETSLGGSMVVPKGGKAHSMGEKALGEGGQVGSGAVWQRCGGGRGWARK